MSRKQIILIVIIAVLVLAGIGIAYWYTHRASAATQGNSAHPPSNVQQQGNTYTTYTGPGPGGLTNG